MTQPIRISVTMDSDTFKSFVSFDLFHHRKAWRRPAVFTTILLVSALVCLTQMGSVSDAWKLSLVLAVIALGLPLVYFGTFSRNLKGSIKKMGLTEPKPFYSLQLDDSGFSIWMAGEQDKAEPSRQCDWHHIHLAYRTKNAIYIYVQQSQAYLWNTSLDAAWELLNANLPADRLHDERPHRAA